MRTVIQLLSAVLVTLLMSCCSDDEFNNIAIGQEITYEVPNKGGKYKLNTSPANHYWALESIKIQYDGKIVTLYDSSNNPYVCENQNLEKAVVYCCNDYSIYQREGSEDVICKLRRNTSGSDRTFIVEFSDGDEFTKVKVHQVK